MMDDNTMENGTAVTLLVMLSSASLFSQVACIAPRAVKDNSATSQKCLLPAVRTNIWQYHFVLLLPIVLVEISSIDEVDISRNSFKLQLTLQNLQVFRCNVNRRPLNVHPPEILLLLRNGVSDSLP
jgi:hypothetical protein